MDERCIAVFTTETPVRILREGGTRGWRVNAERARTIPFLVCVHNHANPAGRLPGSTIDHRAVFMVARISGVVPAQGDNRAFRWKICISNFFRCSVPDAWPRRPNPVKYGTLAEMGLHLDALDWHGVADAQGHIARLTERIERREEKEGLLF